MGYRSPVCTVHAALDFKMVCIYFGGGLPAYSCGITITSHIKKSKFYRQCSGCFSQCPVRKAAYTGKLYPVFSCIPCNICRGALLDPCIRKIFTFPVH